jgi:hypothetical protein
VLLNSHPHPLLYLIMTRRSNYLANLVDFLLHGFRLFKAYVSEVCVNMHLLLLAYAQLLTFQDTYV